MSKRFLMAMAIAGTCALLAVLPSAMGEVGDERAPVAQRYPGRDQVIRQIADVRAIRTPEGIETLEQVDIAGTKQWISIRGRNRNNPVLLFLHGGPGYTMMPLSWAYQNPWEDFFTVVQWDQRGSGKNADSEDKAALKTVTIDRFVKDGEQMIEYLRKRFHKDKIVVMGLSWGTRIGMHLARNKPDWISVYVGVGNASDGSEPVLYQSTLAAARADKNAKAIRELEALAPYPPPDGSWNFAQAVALRRWARLYNGGWYGWPDLRLLIDIPDLAPEYSARDVDDMLPAASILEDAMFKQMRAENLHKDGLTFKVPIVYIQGRYDLQTPYATAKALFQDINAPSKTFVTMERSAHFPMLEEPGRFLRVLLEKVLPLTEGSPEFTEYPRTVQAAPPER